MAYVVKWKLTGEEEAHASPETYATPSDAMDFACTIFKQLPIEIWIEGPEGTIERDAIFRECRDRGSPRS